jgi:hypothetical protein
LKEAAPRRGLVLWLWVFDSVDGWHKVGDEPVCLVGEEEYDWQAVMEVEHDGGWNRFAPKK